MCVQHLEFLLLCDKHMGLRGDLYARGAVENCLSRDAALMSSLHVSQKPLGGGEGAGWRPEVCAYVAGTPVTRPAQLFHHRLLASTLFRERQGCGSHTH